MPKQSRKPESKKNRARKAANKVALLEASEKRYPPCKGCGALEWLKASAVLVKQLARLISPLAWLAVLLAQLIRIVISWLW